MKAITIRQLHDETGRWIRQAIAQGELHVTERGTVVAKLVPASAAPTVPYFSQRKLMPAFRSAKLSGGTEATTGISAERDER